jgi:DNA-binding transcriptional LysR family regulator
MDLFERMATYVRVVEAGSFSAAAKQLRISIAAVSRHITSIEAEVRVPLLMRTTRRMAITPAGHRYYEACVRILREVEDARSLGRGDAFDGLLTVSAPVTFGLACVLPHVRTLMAKHPGMRIDLRLEDRFVDLVGEGIDLAIRGGTAPPASAGVVAYHLVTFPRRLVAAPEYVKRHGLPRTPAALAEHEALMYGSSGWSLRRGNREARVQMKVAFRSNVIYAVRQLAIEGAGIALLPDWFVQEDVRGGALQILLPDWETDPTVVNATYRAERRGVPRVRAFAQHLRAVYASQRFWTEEAPRALRP